MGGGRRVDLPRPRVDGARFRCASRDAIASFGAPARGAVPADGGRLLSGAREGAGGVRAADRREAVDDRAHDQHVARREPRRAVAAVRQGRRDPLDARRVPGERLSVDRGGARAGRRVPAAAARGRLAGRGGADARDRDRSAGEGRVALVGQLLERTPVRPCGDRRGVPRAGHPLLRGRDPGARAARARRRGGERGRARVRRAEVARVAVGHSGSPTCARS